MEIKNKFNLGDTVYYPAADLSRAHLHKAEILGITVDKKDIFYNTDRSISVPEEQISSNKTPAKVKLVRRMKERRDKFVDEMDSVIKEIEEKSADELVQIGVEIMDSITKEEELD
jgi:hypothetical protein